MLGRYFSTLLGKIWGVVRQVPSVPGRLAGRETAGRDGRASVHALSVLRAASVSVRASGPALCPVSPVFAGEYVGGSCGGYGEGESWRLEEEPV